MVLEAGSLRSGCQRGWALMVGLLSLVSLLFSHDLSLVPVYVQGERERQRMLWCLLLYLSKPRHLPSWTHQTLIISPRLHLHIPSHRVKSATSEFWRNTKHSLHNIIEGHNCGRWIDLNEIYRKFLKQFKDWRDSLWHSQEGTDVQLCREAHKSAPWAK